MNYFSRLGLSGILSALDEEPFIHLDAESYISGYDSRLAQLSQYSAPFTDIKGPEKVGLMSEVSIYIVIYSNTINMRK